MAVEMEAPSKMVVEEWNGTASSKLSKTATITAVSSTQLSISRHGSRFNHISKRFIQAFVPEVSFHLFNQPPMIVHLMCVFVCV